MIVISEGRRIDTGMEVAERLRAGATLTTIRDCIFTRKGPYAIADIKQELRQLEKNGGSGGAGGPS